MMKQLNELSEKEAESRAEYAQYVFYGGALLGVAALVMKSFRIGFLFGVLSGAGFLYNDMCARRAIYKRQQAELNRPLP